MEASRPRSHLCLQRPSPPFVLRLGDAHLVWHHFLGLPSPQPSCQVSCASKEHIPPCARLPLLAQPAPRSIGPGVLITCSLTAGITPPPPPPPLLLLALLLAWFSYPSDLGVAPYLPARCQAFPKQARRARRAGATCSHSAMLWGPWGENWATYPDQPGYQTGSPCCGSKSVCSG